MAETVIKIGYTSKGAYSENTTYDRLDVVSFGHGIYASRVANNIGHAVTDPAWWDVFVDADAIDDSISDASAAAVSALTAAGAAEQIATGMLSDVKAGKTAIATALTNQGSVTVDTETFAAMAAKVQNLKLAVPGEIRDFDRCGALGDIDLPVILKNNVRTDYPYSCGVSFFAVDLQTVTLSGADAYLCSDGFFCEGSAVHTFTDNPALYRYIIFYFRTIDYTVPLPVARVRQLIAWNGHPYFVTTAANKVQELISYSPDNYTDNFGQLGGTVAYISVAGISVCATAGMVNGNNTILMMSLKALSSITGGYVVNNCASLATLALPALSSITGGTVAYNCGALATLALPALASIGTTDTPFNLGTSLLCINLPNCTVVDMPRLERINVVGALAGNASRQLIQTTPKVTSLSLPALRYANFISGRDITSLTLGGNKYENATDVIDVSGSLANTFLTNLTVGQGFAINLTLKGCDALTHDVLVAIIANLANQTTDIPLTLKLDSVLIALLSAGEIAVATNKNWNVII